MNILFIVPYVPDLIRVRPYNLIRHLTRIGHHVTVATLWSNEADKASVEQLKKECDRVYAIKTNKLQSLVNCAITLPTARPLQASYSWQPKMASLLSDLVSSKAGVGKIELVHCEHLRGVRYALYLKSIFNRSMQNTVPPIVWDSVDCISLLFQQASKKSHSLSTRMITGFERDRTLHYESWLINQFDGVLVTSPVDKNAFLSMRDLSEQRPEISVIPNGVDLEYFQPDRSIVKEPSTLVISGKMSYHANVSMTHHLVNDIMPMVWSRKPEVKLWIVGKAPPESIKKLARNPNITVTGTVDDIRPYLHKATMAVAPITYNVGIQNKVIEALACGTPVITTSQTVSALSIRPGRDLLVADDPPLFAQEILELIADPERQKSLSMAGRGYVENEHNWVHISQMVEIVYKGLIERKENQIRKPIVEGLVHNC